MYGKIFEQTEDIFDSSAFELGGPDVAYLYLSIKYFSDKFGECRFHEGVLFNKIRMRKSNGDNALSELLNYGFVEYIETFIIDGEKNGNKFGHLTTRLRIITNKNRNRPSSYVWSKLRGDVFERDNYTCQYCGEVGGKLECDHKVPVSKGGGNNLENLATACRTCNRKKSASTEKEFTMECCDAKSLV